MARVLIVDDDAAALPIRRLILERAGHEVFEATEASEARAQFAAARPEVVLLDLRLPLVEDGLTLIREWREASSKLHIVVLCGRTADLEEAVERALVNQVVGKPARSEQLLAALKQTA